MSLLHWRAALKDHGFTTRALSASTNLGETVPPHPPITSPRATSRRMRAGRRHERGQHSNTGGRLWKQTRDGITTTYTYDSNGNRTSVQVGTDTATLATFDAQDRIKTFGTQTYAFTAHGDLQTRTDASKNVTLTLSYDELGNLMKAVTSDATTKTTLSTVAYVVDGLGRRVGRQINGQFDKKWLYRDSLRPIAEVDSVGVFTHFVYANNGELSGAPIAMIRAGVYYRIIKDHLGSVRLVVNAQTGEVAQSIDYDAYGRVLNETGAGFQPFGFAGGLYDADTQLVRFGARDYDPGMGRWTNRDPIGFAGQQGNQYLYVDGDPVNWVDPNGLMVYLCTRIAELKNNPAEDLANGYRHWWIWNSKTGSEAGVGPTPGGWVGIWGGLFMSTSISDHRGAHAEVSWKDVHCEPQPLVDETCSEERVNPSRFGVSLGPWIPLVNDCGTFAFSVITECHEPSSYWFPQSSWYLAPR